MGDKRWWDRARLWRLYFLGDEEGFFDPCFGLAVALQAVNVSRDHAALRPVHPLLPRWVRLWKYIGPPPQLKKGEEKEGQKDESAGGARPMPRKDWTTQWWAEQQAAREELQTACPLSGPTEDAFHTTIPPQLTKLARNSGGAVDAPRMWTTLLCTHFLRSKHEHILVREPDHITDSGSTLLDSAEAWLQLQRDAHPPLNEAFEELDRLAEDQFRAWDTRHDALLGLLQREDQRGGTGKRTRGRQTQYVFTRLLHAARMGHEALSVFLGACGRADLNVLFTCKGGSCGRRSLTRAFPVPRQVRRMTPFRGSTEQRFSSQ